MWKRGFMGNVSGRCLCPRVIWSLSSLSFQYFTFTLCCSLFAVVMLLLVTLVRVSNLCTVGKWWSGLVSRVWSIWDKSILSVIVLNIKPTITKLGVCLSGKSIYHVSTQSWVLIFNTSKWLWKTITCCRFHCNSVVTFHVLNKFVFAWKCFSVVGWLTLFFCENY
jgi:hypothetical protein